jgi:1-phosphatidylinositol phosphodiesterase
VLAVADEFLWLHPYEAVFMRVKNENDVDEGFDTKFTAALDKHPRVYTGKDDNPTLGTIRGKIVILQNFSSGTDFGVQWNDLSIQVEYSMTDQWCQWPVNTPHRRPDMAPLVATEFPVDGQISPR